MASWQKPFVLKPADYDSRRQSDLPGKAFDSFHAAITLSHETAEIMFRDQQIG